MTKNIRVENACNSNFKVIVEVWDKKYPAGSGPDVLVRTINLDYPTSMAGANQDLYITNSRYLLVKEAPV